VLRICAVELLPKIRGLEMGIRWEYLTLHVTHGLTGSGTRGQPPGRAGTFEGRFKRDWVASPSSGRKLSGWDEILGYFSKNGWEIFSIVAIDQITYHDVTGGSYGGTESFRVFAKRPIMKDDEGGGS
jgi:hypothetical protein